MEIKKIWIPLKLFAERVRLIVVAAKKGENGVKKDNETIINEKLLENYQKYYRLAFGYVHNEADALDIVQEGAYKAIFHSDKLKQPQYADTWICRIMMNEAIEFMRKNRADTVEYSNCEAGMEETYEDVDLKNAIDGLSAAEKSIVMLRYFEGMTLEETARAAGENISTVKSRLYRALGKLKLSLEE